MIRPAGQADRTAVESIVRAAYSVYVGRMGREPGPMSADYASLIEAGRVHVAEIAGEIVGVLVLVPEQSSMLLDNIAVSPAAQGAGLGRALLAFAEDQALAAGYGSIRLYTHETMTENIALYSRIGFVETHRAEQDGFHRVFMAKQLG